MLGGAVFLCLTTAAAAAGEPPQQPPVVFESEDVRLVVEVDSLRVEGYYVLRCRADAGSDVTLFYPFPRDPELGGARAVALTARRNGESWQPAAWWERPDGSGMHWRLPAAPGGLLEVHCTYRQARRGAYARYIVTTVSAWGRALDRARFSIELPAGAAAPEFSYPFEAAYCDSQPCWVFETEDFLPDRDITARWR